MKVLPTLDAHIHLAHWRPTSELALAGAALAMTLSLDEASQAIGRNDPLVLWCVGCHPTDVGAQGRFELAEFRRLVEATAVVGEVGLDKKSEVPFERQLQVFRDVLEVVADGPRIVSIHSNHATAEVLEELQKKRIAAPVLHWWSGSDSRTKAAVELGCCFSLNSRIAGYSRFSTLVPTDRILFETDQGYDEPPAAIPGRIEEAERILAHKRGGEPLALRRAGWANLRKAVERTNTRRLLPEPLQELLQQE